MLLVDEQDPARRKALSTINAQAFKAFEMLADLMLFAHPPIPDKTTFSVAELVQQVVSEHEPAASQQQTKLLLEPVSAELDSTTADRTQIGSALSALIKNALEALKLSGEIQLSVAQHQMASGAEFLDFVVNDNGPGITPEIRRHLFDPFFSGREAGRGLGLGLSKAYRVAELHGGDLLVESSVGCGAKFTLRIPLSAG